jgi:putative FmdB family regulatory protein
MPDYAMQTPMAQITVRIPVNSFGETAAKATSRIRQRIEIKDSKMPVYEYRCLACNHQFELRQKFSDAPVDLCPKCGGAVHKMVSASAFSLKGGGWYGDGYGEKAESPKSESDSKTDTAETADSAPKESAPADTSTAAETSASPATSPDQSQSETKSAVAEKAEKPAATEKPKAES